GGTHRLAIVLSTGLSTRFSPHIPLGIDRVLVNAGNNVYAVDAANNPVQLLTNVWFANDAIAGRASRPGWAALAGGPAGVGVRPIPTSGDQVHIYRTDGTPA